MKIIDTEKIEVKKTKTTLTVSMDTRYDYSFPNLSTNSADAFKRLLAISVLSGGGINCIRQVLKSRLSSQVDFGLIKKLQNKADDLIIELVKEIGRVEKLEGINLETHKFI